MKVTITPLDGLIIIEPHVFIDNRGCFYELFQKERYGALGLPPFVQDNISSSRRHVIRALHYQLPHAQGKLVSVLHGAVWDVALDIRVSSKTFGQWFGIQLDDQNHKQLYIPPGFAHGFCVLSAEAHFYYKCTDYYAPQAERGILWQDKNLNIAWPTTKPILAPKDEQCPLLCEISHDELFA